MKAFLSLVPLVAVAVTVATLPVAADVAHEIADLALHDKKAQEWCDRLDEWAHKSQAELEMRIRQARARRRARSAGD